MRISLLSAAGPSHHGAALHYKLGRHFKTLDLRLRGASAVLHRLLHLWRPAQVEAALNRILQQGLEG